jgi:hypothetical protein
MLQLKIGAFFLYLEQDRNEKENRNIDQKI